MSVTVPSQQDAGTLITDTLYNQIVDAIAHVLGLKLGEEALSDLSSNTIIVPTGSVTPYAGSSAPSGWLLCDGSAVSRTTYADLYALIGTTYGSGDGSTTFNLPDLRGRVPLGKDDMGGVAANRVTAAEADTLGGASGEENHTLAVAEMPYHRHSIAHYQYGGGSNKQDVYSGDRTSTLESWGYTQYTGSSGAHNNMPPYQTLNYIIKT